MNRAAVAATIKPPRVRFKHDIIVRVDGRELIDDVGQVANPWRVVPVLETMHKRGAITLDMRRAGEAFHDRFRLAQLDGLRAASMMGGGGGRVVVVNGNEGARLMIMASVAALGGGRAPAASCAWHVLGEEWSLRRWATEFRRGSVNEASGVLIAALGVLAGAHSA